MPLPLAPAPRRTAPVRLLPVQRAPRRTTRHEQAVSAARQVMFGAPPAPAAEAPGAAQQDAQGRVWPSTYAPPRITRPAHPTAVQFQDRSGTWLWTVTPLDGTNGTSGTSRNAREGRRAAAAAAARMDQARLEARYPDGLTATEAALLLGCAGPDTIRGWQTKGRLTPLSVTDRPRFALAELLAAEELTRRTGRIPGAASAYTGRSRIR